MNYLPSNLTVLHKQNTCNEQTNASMKARNRGIKERSGALLSCDAIIAIAVESQPQARYKGGEGKSKKLLIKIKNGNDGRLSHGFWRPKTNSGGVFRPTTN